MTLSIDNTPSEFLTIKELAQKLRVSTKTAYKLTLGGAIRYARVGRQMRIRLEDYDAYISRSKSYRR
jgi:excisionase family DNA binding protein